MINKQIRSVCVFCGSREGSNVKYKESAVKLGYLIAKNDLTLVYGGGNIGLMGLLVTSAQTNNCNIVGIILSPFTFQSYTIYNIYTLGT